MQNGCGFWIGRDIEAVITPVFTLPYRKNIAAASTEAYLLRTEGCSCAGVCRTGPLPRADCGFDAFEYYCEAPGRIEWALEDGTEGTLAGMLGKTPCGIRFEGELCRIEFSDGTPHEARLHEPFPSGAPAPPAARRNPAG